MSVRLRVMPLHIIRLSVRLHIMPLHNTAPVAAVVLHNSTHWSLQLDRHPELAYPPSGSVMPARPAAQVLQAPLATKAGKELNVTRNGELDSQPAPAAVPAPELRETSSAPPGQPATQSAAAAAVAHTVAAERAPSAPGPLRTISAAEEAGGSASFGTCAASALSHLLPVALLGRCCAPLHPLLLVVRWAGHISLQAVSCCQDCARALMHALPSIAGGSDPFTGLQLPAPQRGGHLRRASTGGSELPDSWQSPAAAQAPASRRTLSFADALQPRAQPRGEVQPPGGPPVRDGAGTPAGDGGSGIAEPQQKPAHPVAHGRSASVRRRSWERWLDRDAAGSCSQVPTPPAAACRPCEACSARLKLLSICPSRWGTRQRHRLLTVQHHSTSPPRHPVCRICGPQSRFERVCHRSLLVRQPWAQDSSRQNVNPRQPSRTNRRSRKGTRTHQLSGISTTSSRINSQRNDRTPQGLHSRSKATQIERQAALSHRAILHLLCHACTPALCPGPSCGARSCAHDGAISLPSLLKSTSTSFPSLSTGD